MYFLTIKAVGFIVENKHLENIEKCMMRKTKVAHILRASFPHLSTADIWDS